MHKNSTLRTAIMLLFLLFATFTQTARAAQTDIASPAGGGAFGTSVTVLPNGNIVVTDPNYDITTPATIADVGAVYLYNGTTLNLISTITGSAANDQVSSGGVVVLRNGNFVIRSSSWNGSRGAVTWGSSTTGVSGTVSSSNSLVGSTANDNVGAVTALTNGNYVVRSSLWDNPLFPAVLNVGAVTWGSGTSGTIGAVSITNSLVGSTASDQVGSNVVTALTNGNYVVRSANWDNPSPAAADAGAVTWGSGAGGTIGAVSSSNSLVGSTLADQIGNGGVVALTNGNYVVGSSLWDSVSPAVGNVGAVTWGSGAGGVSGVITNSNSLVGSTASDGIGGNGSITALTNGNYVVRSTFWDNPSPAAADAGAVTWGSGAGGTVGAVSSSNSLVGSTAGDQIGSGGVTALTNGNYVVRSTFWDNPSPAVGNVGAVTWGDGTGGTVGAVSSGNSLVGSTADDNVGGGGVVALTNGNYVAVSAGWDNPSPAAADAGAVTWGNGTGGTVGAVSSSNSLVGSTVTDVIGNNGVVALTNGNYVVRSGNWDNPSPAAADAGAVTWGSGAGGTVGAVSSGNSLVGSTANDNVGISSVVALTNGNYVVSSQNWDGISPAVANAGAVTWGSGTTGVSGAVSSGNSLVGSTADDNVGSNVVTALTNGNYVAISPIWDNTSLAAVDAGAVTWGSGAGGTVGAVSSGNSLVGSTADQIGNNGVTALSSGNYVVSSPFWDNPAAAANASARTFGNGAGGTVGAITDGATGGNSVVGTVTNGISTFAFDPTRNRLFVGRSASNIVSVLFFNTNATADGALNVAGNFDNGVPDALVNGIIPNGRMMTVAAGVMNVGQIQVQCGGSLTGGSAAAYIVGSVRKDFCAAAGEAFVYPIGDPNNYSPLTVSSVTGTGDLTASVTDDFLPGLPQTTSVSRYWSLAGSGITTNLNFTYVDADVNGDESFYRPYKRSVNITTQVNPFALDAANNTVTARSVSSFSDWGIGNAALPTAATVTLSGRALAGKNRGLMNAVVILTGVDGNYRTARTTALGYFRFENVAAGETYIINISSKRYQFASRAVFANEELENLDLTALP